MTRLRLCAAAAACLYLTGAAAFTQAAAQSATLDAESAAGDAAQMAGVRIDTPSGLPVPRIVSLKADKTYCRTGPTFDHPVRLTFMRKDLPVIVIAETRDHWRKLRDIEGDECWAHKSKLSGAKTVLVLEDGLALRARPNATAPAKALLGRGVIAKVEGAAEGEWLRVAAGGKKGWARRAALWGAGAQAPLGRTNAATHN